MSDACDGCGACARACPTGAIELSPLASVALARAGTAAAGGEVVVACRHARERGHVTVPCAGALDGTAALDFAQAGATSVRFASGRCEGCDDASQLTGLPVLLKAAQAVGLRFNGAIPVATARAGTIEPRARALRAMRARLGGPSDLIHEGADPPPRRARLTARSRATGARVFPGGSIRVADACTGCTVCVAICPTRAISRTQAESEVMLMHDPSTCVACGICADACPVHALSSRPGTESIELATVAVVQTRMCRLCGGTHPAQTTEAGLCPTCMKRYGPHHRSRAELSGTGRRPSS